MQAHPPCFSQTSKLQTEIQQRRDRTVLNFATLRAGMLYFAVAAAGLLKPGTTVALITTGRRGSQHYEVAIKIFCDMNFTYYNMNFTYYKWRLVTT